MPARDVSVPAHESAVAAQVEEVLARVRQTIHQSQVIQERCRIMLEDLAQVRRIDLVNERSWK